MAREYPRFLFSNPQNTKSKGPFVVHTMEPRFIVRVETAPSFGNKYLSTNDGKLVLIFLDGVDYTDALHKITDDLFKWFYKSPETKDWLSNRLG